MGIRILGAWFLVLGCLASAGLQARTYEDIQASGFMEVAVYADYPPYSFREDGQARGVDVDMARALAKALGVELQLTWMIADETLDDDLRNYVWKGRRLAPEEEAADKGLLAKPVADVMLRVPYDRDYAYREDPDGLVVNDLVHFFGPYQREEWQLAFDSTRMEALENLAVLRFEPVGVEIDSLPDYYLSALYRGALRSQIHHYRSFEKALAAVASGEVKAVMGQRSEVEWGLKRQPVLKTASVPLPNLAKADWDVGMAVHESHRQLAYALEDQVAAMIREGRMASIYAHYGLEYQLPNYYRRMARASQAHTHLVDK